MARGLNLTPGRQKKKQPPKRKPVYSAQYQKAVYILKTFTPAEIQAYSSIEMPYKIGRKHSSPIIRRTKKIQGTRIPASTIHRFQEGQYRLREGSNTVKKLSQLYKRWQKANLRAHGANKETAEHFSDYTPEKLTPKLHKFLYNAKRIQYNYRHYQNIDKPLEYILYGMAHSKHKASEWDKIAMISGIRKPPKAKRKRGYGSHKR